MNRGELYVQRDIFELVRCSTPLLTEHIPVALVAVLLNLQLGDRLVVRRVIVSFGGLDTLVIGFEIGSRELWFGLGHERGRSLFVIVAGGLFRWRAEGLAC